MITKRVMLYLIGQLVTLASAGIIMFWSAGRIDWWPGWGVIAVWVAWFTAVDVVVFRSSPELMIERMAPPGDSKGWDRVILSIVRLVELARYILAGLDQRYGWTSDFPLTAQIIAALVCVLSAAIFAWAMASNPYFSQVVRIQSDRKHAVAGDGPYRYVRHPGYLGTILFEVALSTLLGSWSAIIAGGICALLFVLRTALEDDTLQTELSGYAEYAQLVRYRLIPGVW